MKDFGDGANALSNAVSGGFDIDFTYRGCAEMLTLLDARQSSQLTAN